VTDRGTKAVYRISDEIWKQIEPLLPPELPRPKGGRPRTDDRKIMEAILFLIDTGFKWKAIPRNLGSPSTIYRRFHEWRETGLYQRMWATGILTYDELRELVWYGRTSC